MSSTFPTEIVVVGTGVAASACVDRIREANPDFRVTVFGKDSGGRSLPRTETVVDIDSAFRLLYDSGHWATPYDKLVFAMERDDAQLARRSGVLMRLGIVVNEFMRTSDPHIFAIGDCVEEGLDPDTLDAQVQALAASLLSPV